MSARVVVVGSFMMDHSAYVERRPEPGETVRGLAFQVSEGGKGFNQAVAAARAGAEVRMLGRIGADDLGRRFLERLAREGVDASGVGQDSSAGTGVGLPVVDRTGENAIVVVPGANDTFGPDLLDGFEALVSDADVLLLQHEVPLETAVRAARVARAAGVVVVLNPAPARPIEALHGLVDIVVPNEGELRELAGEGDRIAAARRLAVDLGGCDVIVTLGAMGALVVEQSGTRLFPADAVDAVDTTGAGDCFCGNLAARLALGDATSDAVRYAVAAAGIAVTIRGGADSAPTRVLVQEAMGARVAGAEQGARRGVPVTSSKESAR